MGWHQKEMNKILTEVLSSCSLRAAIKGPSPAFRQRVRVEPEGIFTKHLETTNFCESSFLIFFQWCAYWIYLKHRDVLLSALKPNRSQVSTMVRLFVCVTSKWIVKPKPKAAWWYTYPEKYQSMGRIIPYIMETKIHVPSHQPESVYHCQSHGHASSCYLKLQLVPHPWGTVLAANVAILASRELVESPIIMLGSMAQNVGTYLVGWSPHQKIIQHVNLERELIYPPKKICGEFYLCPTFDQGVPGRAGFHAEIAARSLYSPFSSRFPHQRRDGHVHLAGGSMATVRWWRVWWFTSYKLVNKSPSN